MDDLERLSRPDGETLAFKRVQGSGPTVLWIGGFRSDMEGTKALALDAAARERGWSYVRYDHFAHGQPPMDEPTGITRPSRLSIRAIASSRQRPMVAFRQSPEDWPWAKWS